MKTARRKAKTKTANPSKRPRPRRGKIRKPIITRAEARRRAQRHVLKRMFQGATVRDGAQDGFNAYGVRRQDTWIVFKNSRVSALKSSDVVVVCKRTGRVLYEGSAHDDG